VKPGDDVILYVTGLGQTVPPVQYCELPSHSAPLKQLADLKVVLDGMAVDASNITYAGIAPGFAGLYQVNVTLPGSTGSNPEIRIGFGDQLSKAGLKLPVAVINTAPSDDQGDTVQTKMPVSRPTAADSLVAHDRQAVGIRQR
jgi:uncharacterized protein (TIGR03437 family)